MRVQLRLLLDLRLDLLQHRTPRGNVGKEITIMADQTLQAIASDGMDGWFLIVEEAHKLTIWSSTRLTSTVNYPNTMAQKNTWCHGSSGRFGTAST